MESDLLCLCKVVFDILVQCHFTDDLYRHIFFRPQFCRIQNIEIHLELIFFIDDLESQLKFCRMTIFYIFPQCLTVEVNVFTIDDLGFVP